MTDLTLIEQAALLPLCVQYHHSGIPDRYWARVPVMRDDGAAQMVTLTPERVERYADDYWERRWTIDGCVEPDGGVQ